MSRTTVDLIPTPEDERPYKIVFSRDGKVIGAIPVRSLDGAISVAQDLIAKLNDARNA